MVLTCSIGSIIFHAYVSKIDYSHQPRFKAIKIYGNIFQGLDLMRIIPFIDPKVRHIPNGNKTVGKSMGMTIYLKPFLHIKI